MVLLYWYFVVVEKMISVGVSSIASIVACKCQ